MTPISLIVAMAQNNVIGIKNDLPWHIPDDLKRFKKLTLGKPTIMGRKTFDSIFARIKKPLPDRPNIIISGSGFSFPGVESFQDLQTAIEETAQKYPDQEIMVIGGASIYEQALPFANKLYLTLIEKNFDGDAWFPKLDEAEWTKTEDEKHEGETPYIFRTLERSKP